MAIILRLDRVMADQKISLNELADRVGKKVSTGRTMKLGILLTSKWRRSK